MARPRNGPLGLLIVGFLRRFPGLRHRLTLILLVAGAGYVGLHSWFGVRLALHQARESELTAAVMGADRAAWTLADPWFAPDEHAKHYLIERRAAQRSARLTGLLDGSGRLVDAEPDSLIGASLDSLVGLPGDRVVEQRTLRGGAVAEFLEDQRVLATSGTLRGAHEGLRFVILIDPRERFAALARDVRAQSTPGVLAGLLIVAIIGWLLERWLNVPSRRLQQAAERFAAGDLAARAGLPGDDEIARAGRAFDRMADAVERTEHELMAARSRLDTILHALPVGVGVISREDPRLLFVNPRLREITGAEAGNHASFERLIARLHIRRPDGTPVRFGELAIARALETGAPARSVDLQLRSPHGEEIPFVAHALPISLLGGSDFDAVVTVVQDRRELLRLSGEVESWRHRFERVVAATGQVVHEWDLQAGTVTSSANHRDVLGWSPAEGGDALETWASRLHPDDADRVQARLETCLRTGEPFDAQYRLRHGADRWISVRDRRFFDLGPDGRPVRMLGTLADVTQRKEVEEQLVQAQKMETIGTLAGGVAHDFNNQLTGLIGHLDLLHDTMPADETSLEHLGIARAAAQRCADLTRGLLAFSRRVESRPKPSSLNAIVEEAARLLRRALPVTVKLETALAPSLPPALVDAGQVQQALLDLCLNASDAMPGGGTVTVTTGPPGSGRAPEGFLELVVADEGAGIAPDVLPRIFEPFFTTKPQGRGTGLGLSLVYGIVSQHGGRIDVDSRPGAGTRFRLLLPAAPAAAAPPALVPPPASVRPARRRAPRLVLVVDDEPVVRAIAMRSLAGAGFHPLEAGGADEAEALLRADPAAIRVVLLDAMMPGRTGLELLPVLRDRRPGLPVVLTSGFSGAPAPLDDPFTTFLPKPFSPKALVAAVQAALATEAARA